MVTFISHFTISVLFNCNLNKNSEHINTHFVFVRDLTCTYTWELSYLWTLGSDPEMEVILQVLRAAFLISLSNRSINSNSLILLVESTLHKINTLRFSFFDIDTHPLMFYLQNNVGISSEEFSIIFHWPICDFKFLLINHITFM